MLATAAVAGASLMAASTSPATAAPVTEIVVPGAPTQPVEQLAAGPNGGVWFVQHLGGTNGSDSQMRVGRVDGAGNLIGATELPGSASFSRISSDGADGAWLRVGGSAGNPALRRVAADLTVSGPVALPAVQDFAVGADGRAWGLSCAFTGCHVYAVTRAMELQTWPAPQLQGHGEVVATAEGVWLTGTGTPRRAAFVTYTGQLSDVALPRDSVRLIGPAAGSDAWWSDTTPAQDGKVTLSPDMRNGQVGKISSTGAVSQVHDLPPMVPATAGNYATAVPGRNGDLLWAQSLAWSDAVDGRLGVIGDAGMTTFDIARHATSIPAGPNSFSGNCTLGYAIHQSVDGAIWVHGAGHPDRIVRRGADGEVRTFTAPSGAETLGRRFVETSPDALWIAANAPAGPRIAKFNPLDPPAGLPRYPGIPVSAPVTTSPRRAPSAKKRPTKAVVRAALRRGLRNAPSELRSLRSARRRALLGPFRIAGPGKVTVTVRAGQRIIAVGTARTPRSRKVALKVRHGARKLLAARHAVKVSVTAAFTGAGVSEKQTSVFKLRAPARR